ncbi:MAG: hypothetical protein ACOZHQ_06935 [Thermodesulfobacteriota bacterium]
MAQAPVMKVALKFCGGCNPDYDRARFWEQTRKAAGEAVTWVRLEDGDHQAVLLICGCPTACPVDDLPAGERLVLVKDAQSTPAEVLARLLERE